MKFGILNQYIEKGSLEDHRDEEAFFDPASDKYLTDGEIGAAEPTAETQALPVVQSPDAKLFDSMDMISTEAAIVGNFTNYFAKVADKVSMNVREGFRYLTTWSFQPMEKLNSLQMSTFVEHLDYDEVSSIKVDQPVGFKGEMLPYCAHLVEQAKMMNVVLDEIIRPATSQLGYYLSNPYERSEQRGFKEGASTKYNVEDYIKKDAVFFASTRMESTTFGKLYNSLGEFVQCERIMTDVSAMLSEGGTSSIKNAVTALSDTATALIERLAKDKDNEPSREFTKMLAEELQLVARWIEWFSMQMTHVIETNRCLVMTERELRKL